MKAYSVQRLATSWTVRGPNSGGGDILQTSSQIPCRPLTFLYKGYGVFPRGKSAEVWRRQLTQPSAFLVYSRGNFTLTIIFEYETKYSYSYQKSIIKTFRKLQRNPIKRVPFRALIREHLILIKDTLLCLVLNYIYIFLVYIMFIIYNIQASSFGFMPSLVPL